MLSATLCLHFSKFDSQTTHDIQKNLYVDNVLSGSPTEESADQYFTKARKIMSEANLILGAGHPIASSYEPLHRPTR